MDQRWSPSTTRWTGVILCIEDQRVLGLSHGQEAWMTTSSLIPGRKYTIYEVLITQDVTTQMWIINSDDESQLVQCPPDECCDLMKIKDVCAGIGGISQGLEHVGFVRLASMDCQDLMCSTMTKNGLANVIKGDANNPAHRAEFHRTPDQTRCLLASGFPCQPLSRQGDGRGAEDERSLVFDSVIRMAWEQQSAGMLLENVVKALRASYIQEKLQKLAWSMGMHYEQVILALDKAWPCRRTRWWMMMIPREYQIPKLLDLPLDSTMQRLDKLIPIWPLWTDVEEDQLRLTEEEFAMLSNPKYGNDERVLQNDKIVPCILHSYANGLKGCPCGCRATGFAIQRLERDGLRGFYLYSQRDGHPRWLHPAEAALLCGINPLMSFPEEPRAGLCLIGQCASALQSTWMGAHIMQAVLPELIDPQKALIGAKMWLLRQAHGLFPSPQIETLQVVDPQEMTQIQFKTDENCTVENLREAEVRLQGPGYKITIQDLMGPLPGHYRLAAGPIHGSLMLNVSAKRQRMTRQFRVLKIDILDIEGEQTMYVAIGTFLFEIFDRLKVHGHQMECSDQHGEKYRLDDRLWEDTMLYLTHKSSINAAGPTPIIGLGDRQIDRQALGLIAHSAGGKDLLWIPSAKFTELFYNMDDEEARNTFKIVTQNQLGSCVAVQGHWLLMIMFLEGHTLHVECWDGLDHSHNEEILSFADDMRTGLTRHAHIKTKIVTFANKYQQLYPMTCGTIALMHLGHKLGYWTNGDEPQELALHLTLQDEVMPSVLRANGKPYTEEELRLKISSILQEHGVAAEHTADRFHAAVKKIGHQKLSEALDSKNSWAALKAAGSQPKVNFLWVKPDELDKQIKRRAESKFKVATSNKKGGYKGKQAQINIDPTELGLIPGTFVTEDDRPVTQLNIDEVASDRSGIAFGTLADAAPFLKNDKSITLDALAILTTMPVPPTEQGLIPVTNLRYPAKYGPTQEAILVEGSLIQLGDCSILRKLADELTKLEPLETRTYKISVWKDEWTGEWDSFVESPVRNVTKVFPRLLLCKGDKCGPGCMRFHAPVDSDVDNVIVDLWGRAFLTARGKRIQAGQSDLYQFLVRIPKICCEGLQQKSGFEGIYLEPRQQDGKNPRDDMAVVWMSGSTKADVVHQMKIHDRSLALARFGNRWGIRTWQKDAAALHQELHPDVPYSDVAVQAVYEVRPLPHGIQKSGVQDLLKQWSWRAKPLQPSRGDQHGAGWLVGGDEPPAWIFQTSEGDILVSTHKKAEQERQPLIVLGSQKTKAHMKNGTKKTSPAAQGKENAIPFEGKDPWGGVNSFKPAASSDQSMVTSRLEQVQTQVHDSVQSSLRKEQEDRFRKLETGFTELKEQNRKFESWFHEAGKCSQNMQQQVNNLAAQVTEQKAEIGTISSQLTHGFANLEALLNKRQRTMDD